jgi:hypothetical protein
MQGCHNGRPMVKITVRTSAYVPVYPHTRFYPRTGFYRPRTHSFPYSPSRELPSPLPCRRSLLSVRTGYVRVAADTQKIK